MRKISLAFMSCCLPESWIRIREDKEGLKKFLTELKKGDITLHRFFPFYPRPIPLIRKKIYLAPWKLVKSGNKWVYDLDQWDEQYWELYKEFILTFHLAGIDPVVSLFDYCHRFVPRDRERSPFIRNLQNVDVLNPRRDGITYLWKLIDRQLKIIRELDIDHFYVETGNELFRERRCCPEGSKDCKPTPNNWCGHELVRKIGEYLAKKWGIKPKQILVPTGYKGGDFFHNTGIFGFKGAHPKNREFHPDFHLGALKKHPPTWDGWNDHEWKNFLQDFTIYFSTDGLDGGERPEVHAWALNWAIDQAGLEHIFALEVQPGWLWTGEKKKNRWGDLSFMPKGYFKRLKKLLNLPPGRIAENKTCLCGVKIFIDNNYTFPEPEPEPEPEYKPWWKVALEFLWDLIKEVFR